MSKRTRTIYSSRIDINTLEFERYSDTIEDYENENENDDDNQSMFAFMYDKDEEEDENEEEYADYDTDGFECLYSESFVSQEAADKLVIEKAKELRDKFQGVLDKYQDAVQNVGNTDLSPGTSQSDY